MQSIKIVKENPKKISHYVLEDFFHDEISIIKIPQDITFLKIDYENSELNCKFLEDLLHLKVLVFKCRINNLKHVKLTPSLEYLEIHSYDGDDFNFLKYTPNLINLQFFDTPLKNLLREHLNENLVSFTTDQKIDSLFLNNIENLKILNIYSNEIFLIKLPKNINQLFITSFPKDFQELTNFKNLTNLSIELTCHYQLNQIEFNILNELQLENLYLNKISLNVINELNFNNELIKLHLTNCEITDFSFLQNFTNLEIFILEQNFQNNIHTILLPKSLQEIELLNCFIENFTFLKSHLKRIIIE